MLAPTLIVGLGGVGSDITKRVCLQTSEEKKKRVKFVAIDTDVNDLERLRKEAPQVQTIQTSAPYTVGEYLHNNTVARDTWFPTHHILATKTPTEGAGQVRAISRLAFDTALREGCMRPLEKAIEELYTLNGESVQQALRVIVVASLAGGTGSGVILPAAVYIKNFLEKRLRRSACVMRGFLLLPDVFFSGKSPEEINNLGCNGYAALRELDAFMRRSDTEKESGSMFREMTLLMPDTATGEYVDYKNAPFNFCFLFGAQNTADQDLRSFEEYKAQAANIVYAQAVSALSARSNSNEDNTILTLCSGNGHNRFCGAGSSRMYYPQKDVVRYLADQWALTAMGRDWLNVDDEYRDYCRRQEIMQERDPSIEIQPLEEFYMQTVEGKAEASAFFGQIYNNCTDQDPGSKDKRTGRWIQYIGKLDEAITAAIARQQEFGETESAIKTSCAQMRDKDVEKVQAARGDLYAQLTNLFKQARSCANAAASDVINNLLLLDGDLTGSPDARNLEFWLRDNKKNFLQPVAARYFLYGLKQELDRRVQDAEQSVSDARKLGNSLDAFLDDPETSEVEGIDDYAVSKKFLAFELVDSAQVDELIEESNKFAAGVRKDFEETTKLLVLQAAQRQVGKMIAATHLFFDTLRTCLEKTGREQEALHIKYNNGEGHAVYFVCSDAFCLDHLAEEMGYNGGSVNGPLGAAVFNAVKQASLAREMPGSKEFLAIYDSAIMPFWEKAVLERHGAKLETTVIDALMTEAGFYRKEAGSMEEKLQYCREKLQITAKLAEPFIEKPMGEVRHPIAVCCYSKALREKFPDFITRTLSDEGGIAEEGIGDDEIIFYHAIYGIRAVDLAQFSPAVNTRTFKRRAGAYFAAYKNRVRGLGPVLSKNTEITPHLDRNWHLAKYLPDLSDEVHEQEIKRVYRAMVWGLVSGNIKFSLADRLYVPESNDNRDFIVPSREGDAAKDNPCDKLSELLDALAVNPPQVSLILHSLESQISNELRDRKRFGETLLARRLKWRDPARIQLAEPGRNRFRISEFDDSTDASIFDLLYWVKYSTPVDDYDVANMNLLRDAILELLEYYVARFVDESAYKNACALVMVDQLQQFVENLLAENDQLPPNRILDDTVGMVTSALTRRFREEYLLESPDLEDTILNVEEQIKRIRTQQQKNPFAG